MKENRELLRVVITVDTRAKGWERLAPGFGEGGSPVLDGCEFFMNPEEPVDADYWIVFANARPRDMMRCAPENTLFIAGEPESKKVYPKAFYRQFHRIIDTHVRSGHPRVTLHAPCMAWHIGFDHNRSEFDFGYTKLKGMESPKTLENKVSVVCSDAAFTDGQRERLRFLEELKARLGDKLVHFGRGFRPVDDKLDAILGYRFHLVMENSRIPHYWTEKIADAYLGWSFPLYVGSPNLGDYFPEESFVSLDVNDPVKSAETISRLLDKPVSDQERVGVAEGRRLVLDVYNPWVAWARWANEFHVPNATPKSLVIRSHKAFRSLLRGFLFRLK